MIVYLGGFYVLLRSFIMLTLKKFDVLKKGRKYYAAKVGGYDCKIIINDFSDNLAPGEHILTVIDRSERNKFGTKLIFEVAKEENGDFVYLKHDYYNTNLIKEAKRLGGRWDEEMNAWCFSNMVKKEIDDLDAVFNSQLIAVEVTFKYCHGVKKQAIYLFGMKVASAFGRDTGVKLYDVACIAGNFYSGGSRKNWETIAEAGTTVRMKVPQEVFNNYPISHADVMVKVVD